MTRKSPIGEGDIIHVLDLDGTTIHEAIADGPVEHGEVWVRFTTRGREIPIPAKRVTKVSDPW